MFQSIELATIYQMISNTNPTNFILAQIGLKIGPLLWPNLEFDELPLHHESYIIIIMAPSSYTN